VDRCGIDEDKVYKECKQKQEANSQNIVVRWQLEQVKQNRKRKFTSDTQTKRDGKVEEAMAVKKERRLFL
jgi:hypothetical protein